MLLADYRHLNRPQSENGPLTQPSRKLMAISMKLESAARQLEALGNPTRLRIYRVLVRAGADGLPVGRLQARIGIAASTLSHHLKRLVEAGLVTQERQATTLFCRTHYPTMDALIGFLSDECCADAGLVGATKEHAA